MSNLRQIWKFPLEVTDVQTISMPMGAKIMHVDVQHDQVCLWAGVYPDNSKMDRTFHLYGTGHAIPDDVQDYLGSVVIGPFVWHLFEVT